MDVVKGNKKEKISIDELLERVSGFSKVFVDLGTGDGRFVYKNALANPEIFYVGIDPSEKQLRISSREIQRKKLNNALLVVGSVEQLPNELTCLVDRVYVNFPWGSLLETFAKPIIERVNNIFKLLKNEGHIEVIFGYNKDLEPSETKRLDLPQIDLNYISNYLIPKYEENGLKVPEYGKFDSLSQKVETTWRRKLTLSDRDWFFLKITT